MTTAHRPTFDPARGKDALRGPAYHQRLLPAHTFLKHRQQGQGGAADADTRDLRAELLNAEASAKRKRNGIAGNDTEEDVLSSASQRSQIEIFEHVDLPLKDEKTREEDPEIKRRRLILEEAQDIDADSDGGGSSVSEEEDEEGDDEDEEAELMRELAKIKTERAAAKAEKERQQAAKEEEQRVVEIARGNPLLNKQEFNVNRRWDDDVVFRNQARGTEDKGKRKEFVNDLLRSDFHKRFMVSI